MKQPVRPEKFLRQLMISRNGFSKPLCNSSNKDYLPDPLEQCIIVGNFSGVTDLTLLINSSIAVARAGTPLSGQHVN